MSREAQPVARALLFDVGEVMMESNWVLCQLMAERRGRAVGARGPYDPDGDRDWASYLAGTMSADEYWDARARETGYATRVELFRATTEVLDGQNFAPDALALIAEARAAGVATGVLSNDLVRFSGREWIDRRPELAGFEVFVDATEFGARKPSPAIYLQAAADFGLPPEEIVFLDDTPACIEGARAVGMIGVHIDPTQRWHGFDLARRLVGLVAPTDGQRLVRASEAAAASRDLAKALALVHPDVVIHWNGVKVAVGLDAARVFHIEHLGFDAAERPGHRVTKTLRAEDGDTISIEWESSCVGTDGRPIGSMGAELWVTRYGRIIEWHGYECAWDGRR